MGCCFCWYMRKKKATHPALSLRLISSNLFSTLFVSLIVSFNISLSSYLPNCFGEYLIRWQCPSRELSQWKGAILVAQALRWNSFGIPEKLCAIVVQYLCKVASSLGNLIPFHKHFSYSLRHLPLKNIWSIKFKTLVKPVVGIIWSNIWTNEILIKCFNIMTAQLQIQLPNRRHESLHSVQNGSAKTYVSVDYLKNCTLMLERYKGFPP